MSDVGMIETLAEHDEFALVSISGGRGGEILDCDGETVTIVHHDLEAVAKAFPLIIRLYRKGFDSGERHGRYRAQCDMQKALGLDGLDHRVRKLECDVFPGECMA